MNSMNSDPPSDARSDGSNVPPSDPSDFNSEPPSELPSELNSTLGSSPQRHAPESLGSRSLSSRSRRQPPSSPTSSVGFSETESFPLPSSPSATHLQAAATAQGAAGPNDGERELEDDELRRVATVGLEGIPKVTDAVGEKVQEQFERFLTNFRGDDGKLYYIKQIHGLRKFDKSTVFVNWEHLEQPSNLQDYDGGALATAIKRQYYRFLPFLQRALRNVIKKYEPALIYKSAADTQAKTTGLADDDDEIASNAHRSRDSEGRSQFSMPTVPSSATSTAGTGASTSENEKLFQLGFYGLAVRSKLRDLRTDTIGALISFTGTVTRTSEVRPELYRGTFQCEACLTEVTGVEQAFKYTEPYMCPNPTCQNRTSWSLIAPKSQFMDWQRVRVQENPGDIPTGSMPRTIDVVLRGDIVERAKAGDRCLFTGTEIVVPDVAQLGLPGFKPLAFRDRRGQGRGEGIDGAVTGLSALGVRDLTYRLAFLACMTQEDTDEATTILNNIETVPDGEQGPSPMDEQEQYLETLDAEEVEDLRMMIETDMLYSKLVRSIAPAVWGHESVKKGVLLQLLGGVHKTTPEGIQLRGDINVCIVGDPSTSKSQFLKYVTGFLPRSVYTSGKASSAAGLTAAVVKDEETAEFTIEAGALMLADNGICAIDEFDKMDLGDQVAIHEAMEQQTISIAKAGIHATLNARTSILAAANPIGGRYNQKLSLRSNINMSAPIMSRFDLFFVVLDECNAEVDRRLADHIVSLHMNGDDAIDPPFSTKQLLRYITYARLFKPRFADSAKALLVEYYKELRQNDVASNTLNPTARANGAQVTSTGRSSYRITVRQLESLIRLSEAIARAHCLDTVTNEMVTEAYNLLRASIIRVEHEDIEIDDASLMHTRHIDRSNQTDSLSRRVRDDEGGQSGRSTQKISYDRYMLMMRRLVQEINRRTSNADDDMDIDAEGVDAQEIENWYLETEEDNIDSEERFYEERRLVHKVLRRMVKDHVLMELRGGTTDLRDTSSSSHAVKYVIHPNAAMSWDA